MTQNEFIETVDAGNDVMFECLGKKFAIVMTESGVDIAEQETCENRMVFEDAQRLLDNYKIAGKPLTSVLPQCHFTFIS